MPLPQLQAFSPSSISRSGKKALVVCEGFEQRSLEIANQCKTAELHFDVIILVENRPKRQSKKKELLKILEELGDEIIERIFFRFDPGKNETDLQEDFRGLLGFDEIILDISVMSKLFITWVIHAIRSFEARLIVVYVEPVDYAPVKNEVEEAIQNGVTIEKLPSHGIFDVVRISALTSTVMQDAPSAIVGFTSFNENLLAALLESVSPTKVFLIACSQPRIIWHAAAMEALHNPLIESYPHENPTVKKSGLRRRACTLDYSETFGELSRLYRELCYTNRIVVAPTGSKMQALACGLFKSCCHDVHIEYPTPESFLEKGFSTPEIFAIHMIEFVDLKMTLKHVRQEFSLDG